MIWWIFCCNSYNSIAILHYDLVPCMGLQISDSQRIRTIAIASAIDVTSRTFDKQNIRRSLSVVHLATKLCAWVESTMGMHYAQSIGVATVANKKVLSVTLVDCVPQFDAHWSQFFTEFNWFIMLTSRLNAYVSRYGEFCAINDNEAKKII